MGTDVGFSLHCLDGSQATPYYIGASSWCLLMHAALRSVVVLGAMIAGRSDNRF